MKAKRRALAERCGVMGPSQERLAEIVGVELSMVGRWERGETSPQPCVAYTRRRPDGLAGRTGQHAR